MSENLTALASENLNPSLRSLLEDVQRGHIRVPRFQRPFVWSDEQRLELLRSIRDNMPIGSLLVWRTSAFKLASFPTVGPHYIPAISEQAPATGWQYLLDGHQRVSTLLGLLIQPLEELKTVESVSDEDSIDWNIQLDLLDIDFVFDKQHKKAATRPLLPLWTLLDGRLVNRQMRALRKDSATHGWTEENLDQWEERADQIAYRFQQCRIPIVIMVTDDLALAARTFQRINSLGTPMDEAHLVAALTWTEEFDLRERVAEQRANFATGWRELDEGLFLQVCKGLARLDMTKAGQTELVKILRDDPKLLERAGSGLRRAVQLLEAETFVFTPELLPYALQLSLLAVELDRWTEGTEPTAALVRWFWRTGYSAAFASATYRTVASEQTYLRAAAQSGDEPTWTRDEGLPARFDFRSARVRLASLRLAARHSLVDVNGAPTDGCGLLRTHGREAFVRLFPLQRRASESLKQLLQGPGNRFLISPSEAGALKERLEVGPDLDNKSLESHFVDAQALAALRAGSVEGFVRHRAAAMDSWDRGEWEKLKAIPVLSDPDIV